MALKAQRSSRMNRGGASTSVELENRFPVQLLYSFSCPRTHFSDFGSTDAPYALLSLIISYKSAYVSVKAGDRSPRGEGAQPLTRSRPHRLGLVSPMI